MAEIAYYVRREAHFESFSAENYVDYMTNVMPIPESHIFWIPSKGVGILCEVSVSGEDRVLRWRVEHLDELPKNAQPVKIDEQRIKSVFESLVESQESARCPICEENLLQFIRFF
jgi:hypothetical protein